MSESEVEIEKTTLTQECGHHCGTITPAPKHRITRHCSCIECHDAVVNDDDWNRDCR